MTKKLHATGPASLPLCGRQLSIHRAGEGRYDIGQGTMGLAAAGQPVTCRHCLRVMGVLPPVRGRGRNAEGELEPQDESWLDEAEREGEEL